MINILRRGNKANIFTGALLGAAIGIGTVTLGTYYFALFIVLVSFLALLTKSLIVKDSFLGKILLIAFLFRIGLAIFQSFFGPLPDSDADAMTFERIGWEIAEAWANGWQLPERSSAYLYSRIIGAIYLVAGRMPLLPQLLNVLLGVLIVYVTYFIVIELGGARKSAQMGALVAALFPTLNLYSAITMRENFISVLAGVSVLYFFKWMNSGKAGKLVAAALYLLMSSAVHGAMIFIGIVYIVYAAFYKAKEKKWRAINRQTVLYITLFFFAFFLFNKYLLNKVPGEMSLFFSPEYLSQVASSRAHDSGAYLVGFTPDSSFESVIQTPIRVLFFLFSPFPWMISSAGHIFGMLDALLYMVLIFFLLIELKKHKRRDSNLIAAAVLMILIFIVVFSWGTSNFGTAIRHRQKIVWLIIAVSALRTANNFSGDCNIRDNMGSAAIE